MILFESDESSQHTGIIPQWQAVELVTFFAVPTFQLEIIMSLITQSWIPLVQDDLKLPDDSLTSRFRLRSGDRNPRVKSVKTLSGGGFLLHGVYIRTGVPEYGDPKVSSTLGFFSHAGLLGCKSGDWTIIMFLLPAGRAGCAPWRAGREGGSGCAEGANHLLPLVPLLQSCDAAKDRELLTCWPSFADLRHQRLSGSYVNVNRTDLVGVLLFACKLLWNSVVAL